MTSKLPYALRYSVSQVMAFSIYWPLARFAGLPKNWAFQ